MDEIKEKNNILIDQPKKKSSNKFVLFISLLLTIIFIIALYFFGNKFIDNEKIVEQKIKKIEGIVSSIDNTINKNQLRLVNMQNQLDEYESEKDVLADLVSQPVKEQFNINKDYALVEVEHLLTIANHNLLLGYNHETLLSALDAASSRLNGINIKEVSAVQEQLIKNIDVLRANNSADIDNMILLLTDLAERIDSFPLKRELMQSREKRYENIGNGKTEGVKKFFTLILKELKGLVVITHNENPTEHFFLPNEINLLNLNIKLELANARFSLLNRDKQNLNASVQQINHYLRNYYDLSNTETQDAYDGLSQMIDLELSFPKIDINSTLESVRALIRFQNERDNTIDNGDSTK